MPTLHPWAQASLEYISTIYLPSYIASKSQQVPQPSHSPKLTALSVWRTFIRAACQRRRAKKKLPPYEENDFADFLKITQTKRSKPIARKNRSKIGPHTLPPTNTSCQWLGRFVILPLFFHSSAAEERFAWFWLKLFLLLWPATWYYYYYNKAQQPFVHGWRKRLSPGKIFTAMNISSPSLFPTAGKKKQRKLSLSYGG